MSVRGAVRDDLQNLSPGDRVIVAVSGGADSVVLALTLLEEAGEFAIKVGAISIDHQLQEGSRERAEKLISLLRERGADPAEVVAVNVGTEGGLEAAARDARYEALDKAAAQCGASAIYLGHTASDQAEGVLLGLLRGSGARSLSGMAKVNGIYRRPLLGLTREEVRKEATRFDFPIWDDPHNDEDRFSRVRIRKFLVELENRIGPGIESALVRTASLLRDDADALDLLTSQVYPTLIKGQSLDLKGLMEFPRAIRTRVIKTFLRDAGLPLMAAEHIDAVEALASQWRGQGAVALPGHVDAAREDGLLTLRSRG